MRRIIIYLLPILIATLASCSNDTVGGGVTDPFGGGGGGQGAVNFIIGSTNGQQGGIIFTAVPSVDVKITQVTVALPAQQFTDVLQGDGTTVFGANQTAQLEEYVGVEKGQQWTFKFEGTLSNGGQVFNVTSNYTIP